MGQSNEMPSEMVDSLVSRRGALRTAAQAGVALMAGAGAATAQSSESPSDGGERYVPGSLNLIRTGPRGKPPVIFLHPLGLDLTYWTEQIETLSAEQDVVAFDWPGSGRSPGTAADWDLGQATELVAQAIRDTGAQTAHVVGISVGGMIAQSVAIEHPDLMQSLILVATAPTFPDAARDGMRARAAAVRQDGMSVVIQPSIERWLTPETVETRPALVDRITKTILLHDPQVHAAMWELVADFEVLDRLGEISAPTLILVGEEDPSTPVASAQLLHDGIAGSTMEVIPGGSHMIQLERPERVSTAIADFVKSHNET